MDPKNNNKLAITVLLAAKNEEINISKCLESLKPVEKIFVLDSHSSDKTAEISLSFGAEVIQFNYSGGYPKKRQWALENLDIQTPWVFLIDADEVVSEILWNEIRECINKNKTADAYMIKKGFHFLGKKMKFGGFSFDAVLLFKTGKGTFEKLVEDDAFGFDMEVHERIIFDGKISRLRAPIIHEDFKNLEAYISRHTRKAKRGTNLLQKVSMAKIQLSQNYLATHKNEDGLIVSITF